MSRRGSLLLELARPTPHASGTTSPRCTSRSAHREARQARPDLDHVGGTSWTPDRSARFATPSDVPDSTPRQAVGPTWRGRQTCTHRAGAAPRCVRHQCPQRASSTTCDDTIGPLVARRRHDRPRCTRPAAVTSAPLAARAGSAQPCSRIERMAGRCRRTRYVHRRARRTSPRCAPRSRPSGVAGRAARSATAAARSRQTYFVQLRLSCAAPTTAGR